jgi:uncharacterized protein YegP (UPF0339 family)
VVIGFARTADRWRLVAENGEVVADSAEGYRHKGYYAITTAKKLDPAAELVNDNKSES